MSLPFSVRFLHLLPPEMAHKLAVMALRYQLLSPARQVADKTLATSLWGKEFINPIGLAAGFDKDALCIDALLAQGFGFIEVGTVTPRPQKGNPTPRLFRLSEDEAIINRMGFNNKGLAAFVEQLKKTRKGIVGANIGKNKTSEDAVEDYIIGLRQVYGLSDYITINIFSPNTPGLRALQAEEAFDQLLSALVIERASLAKTHGITVPLLVKVAPDISTAEQEAVAGVALKHQLDGLIVSNTTIGERGALRSPQQHQTGGLSGKPLFNLSTDVLREIYRLTKGKIPLIGVGGVSSGADAYQKIRAGASLVQIYSALIYQGFGVVQSITEELASLLKRDGFTHVSEAVGVDSSRN